MKFLLIFLASASLTGCAINPKVELPNGCFVDARHHQWVMVSAEKAKGASAQSLLIGFQFTESGVNHVVHAFEHRGQTWVYDPAHGSIKISNGLVFDPRRILYLTYPARQTQKIILL
jgi:hypothetical protein